MNKLICSIVASLAVATSLYAGQQKAVVAPAAPEASPFYVAIDGGLNFAQNGLPSHGFDTVEQVGWTGGLKLGYDFNPCCQGLITPVAELEGLYTNFSHQWNGDIDDMENGTFKTRIGTFAYMANGIAKFNLGAWQPYVGAGLGWFSAKAKYATSASGYGQEDWGSQNRDGFAWQLLAGVDYNITSSWSVFTEYKWLNCVVRNSDEFVVSGSNLGQHLVTAGVRYHF